MLLVVKLVDGSRFEPLAMLYNSTVVAGDNNSANLDRTADFERATGGNKLSTHSSLTCLKEDLEWQSPSLSLP